MGNDKKRRKIYLALSKQIGCLGQRFSQQRNTHLEWTLFCHLLIRAIWKGFCNNGCWGLAACYGCYLLPLTNRTVPGTANDVTTPPSSYSSASASRQPPPQLRALRPSPIAQPPHPLHTHIDARVNAARFNLLVFSCTRFLSSLTPPSPTSTSSSPFFSALVSRRARLRGLAVTSALWR